MRGYKTSKQKNPKPPRNRVQLLGSSSEFCPRRPRSSKRLWPKATAGPQQQWRQRRGLPVGLSRRSPVPLTSKHTSSCASFSLLPDVSPGWLWRRRSWSFLSQDGGEPAGGRSLCCRLSLLCLFPLGLLDAVGPRPPPFVQASSCPQVRCSAVLSFSRTSGSASDSPDSRCVSFISADPD